MTTDASDAFPDLAALPVDYPDVVAAAARRNRADMIRETLAQQLATERGSTGVLAATAVLEGLYPMPIGSRVGVMLRGGNVDLSQISGWIPQEKPHQIPPPGV